jgi:uracil-DNA glycosylase family 4
MRDSLARVSREVTACERCPRLRRWCRQVAQEKVKRFRDQAYWGRPVPGFGDPRARLLVVGLAPAAHGGNRTGRVFTGDRSGDFLFAGLHRAGFASQPESSGRDDGLVLHDCYIAPVARCAPPANKPTRLEIGRCREYLAREWALLENLSAVLVLGRIAMDGLLAMLRENGRALPRRLDFAHGAAHDLGDGVGLFCSYHVSQQNTFTGRLTPGSFDAVLATVQRHLSGAPAA